MTTSPGWDAALKTYLGRRALLDLDNQIGSIAKARRQYDLSPRDPVVAASFAKANRDHRTLFQTPLVEAVVALIATPAPDLDAVKTKHSAAGRSAKTHPEMLAGAFDLIAADIERLTGVTVLPDQHRAAA